MNLYEKISNKLVRYYMASQYDKHDYSYSPSIEERYSDVPTFINSWQAVCMEGQVKKGKIISKNIMGENIIIWKDKDDKISVLEAYCPHLGVHLGSTGKIVGNYVKCSFHTRCFNTDGICNNKKKKGIYSYPIDINSGIVFVWFNSERSDPTWEVPRLEKDFRGMKWNVKNKNLIGAKVKSHPIDFIENGIDFNHAIKLHNLKLKNTTMTKNNEILSVVLDKENNGSLNFRSYGPFIVDYNIDFYHNTKHIFIRSLVLLQLLPDGSYMANKLEMVQAEKEKSIKWKIYYKFMFIYYEYRLFRTFIKEDHVVMINRKHLIKPNYDEEDYYIESFRAWYKQFYPVIKS